MVWDYTTIYLLYQNRKNKESNISKTFLTLPHSIEHMTHIWIFLEKNIPVPQSPSLSWMGSERIDVGVVRRSTWFDT